MDSQQSQDLLQQLAEMRAELNSYRAEVQSLRQQLNSGQILSEVQLDSSKAHAATSRRRVLKQMMAGAAGVGLLSFAAISGSANTALAETAGDNAIDATPGPAGYAARLDTGGLANLYLQPSASTAFVTGTHQVGELYVNSNGDLFYCAVAGTETTSQWRRVAGSATAGSLTPLATPKRFIDTRPAPTGVGDPGNPYGNGTSRQYNMTTLGGGVVPAGARGVIGNVTIVAPSSGGYLQISPAGLTGTDPATMNFSAGVVLGNSFFSALNATGQMTVQTTLYGGAGASTNLIIDITGYYL
jgi:hypothetical protein